jgi:hypothetical protein
MNELGFVQPVDRRARVDGVEVELKVDVRNYVYEGRVQLMVARMFQGQTTNFRTPGGGFAPVVQLDDTRFEALGIHRKEERRLDPTEPLGAFGVASPLM